jgi:ABC-type polysaccharide/polyol phosphate export permease
MLAEEFNYREEQEYLKSTDLSLASIILGQAMIPLRRFESMPSSSVLQRLLSHSMTSESTQRKITIWIELISLLVARDLRVRYRGSFFGYLWSMANPLFYMIILSFVFSHVMKFKIPNFPLFILSGVLAWNLFHQSLAIGVNSIIANGSLLKKVQVPAAIFPASSVASVFVNFCLAIVPFFLLSIYYTHRVSGAILFLPICLLPFLAFILGVVLAISSLNVSFRDIGHILEPVLQAVFYATPIVYPAEQLPSNVKEWLDLNPMTHFIGAFRQILFEQSVPPQKEFFLLFALACLSLLVGTVIFQKRRHRFIYEL